MALFDEDSIFTEPFSGQLRTHTGLSAIRASFRETWEQPLPDMTLNLGRVDLDADPEGIATLYREFRKTLPGVKFGATARQASVGVRPMSPDGAPLVGWSGPHGCLVAVGHGRNGWLLGPVTGAAAAALVRGEDAAAIWTPFAPDRFD